MAVDQRAASLKFLTVTGLIPVKVRPGQKDPFPEWDPRRVALEDHGLTLKALQNDPRLNIGALFSGKYVDIDIDNTNPYLLAALDWFLPKTPYVWGRKTKPRSHRVYALHADFERGPWSNVLRYIKGLAPGQIDELGYSVEVRGGTPENGLFSVLPGSTHPSGEMIEWERGIDPTVGGAFVEVARLVKALRLAVVVAMVAPHWQPGSRNDLSLALAGTLWRIRASTMAAFGMEFEEEPPEGYYVLTEEDATSILTAIMTLANDEENDKRSRLINLKNTWRKLAAEPEIKITGGKVLAELIGEKIGNNVVKGLYRLLSDNDSAEQIEALAEQFVMWYGQGVLIDMKMIANNRSNPWMNKMQADASLAGKNLTIAGQKVPVSKLLFSSGCIQRVAGLTFDPSTTELITTTAEGLMVNQWRGFQIQPCPQRVTTDEVSIFTDYIREVVANGDEAHAHWVFSWLADIIKHPDKKPGTALVLVGVEGAGKTFLGEHIIGKIIGPAHYGQTNSISTLTHNFNTIIDNKIFLQCDEAVHSYQRDVASRLKSIITDDSIIIEPKGINSYRKPNHMRFLFTSNEEHAAIFISPSPYERRFTVLRASAKHARDEKYWDTMHLWTPQALPKIMRWLMDYHYERWLIMRPLETTAKQNIQRTGVDTEVSWILSRITEGFPLGRTVHQHWFDAYDPDYMSEHDRKSNVLRRDVWPKIILYSALEEDYKNYVRGLGKQVHTGSVATSIRRVLPSNSMQVSVQMTVRYVDSKSGQVTQSRTRLHTWPTAAQITSHLRSRYGEVIDDLISEATTTSNEVQGVISSEPERGEI